MAKLGRKAGTPTLTSHSKILPIPETLSLSPTPGFRFPPARSALGASFLASGPRKSQIPNPAPMDTQLEPTRAALIRRSLPGQP